MSKELINKLRRRIDLLDQKLIKLLNERMSLAEKIGVAKQTSGMAVTDAAREREVLSRLKKHNSGPLPDPAIEDIYREIFSAAKNLEKSGVTAYLGPEATFTHLAALKHFGRTQKMVPMKSIRDVFRAVEKGECHQGVVPVENSTEGTVTHTLDMFIDSPLLVADEIYLEVHHHLVSREEDLGKITVIYSHPQALSQCQEWLREKVAGVSLVEVPSTAEAARKAARKKGSAAIASELAGRLYNLNIIARRIEDRFDNLTHFLVVAQEDQKPSGQDKTSILFSIKDRIGALHDILAPIAGSGINLSKIESRPSRRKAWDYVFFVDMEGHRQDSNVAKILGLVKNECPFFKILGSYPNRKTGPR